MIKIDGVIVFATEKVRLDKRQYRCKRVAPYRNGVSQAAFGATRPDQAVDLACNVCADLVGHLPVPGGPCS
jgi:hypothetical protein